MKVPFTNLTFLERQALFDEQLEIGYIRSGLWILRASGAYPDLHKNYWFSCLHVFILYIQLIYFFVLYLYSIGIALYWQNTNLICKMLLYCCFVGFYTVSFNMCHLKRGSLDSLLRTIGRGFSDYSGPISRQRKSLMNGASSSYRRFKRVYLMYSGLIGLYFSLLSPLFKVVLSGSWSAGSTPINENGIMPIWRPLDTSRLSNYLLAFAWETVFTYLMLLVIISIDLSFVSLIDNLSKEFAVAAQSVKELEDRAMALYRKNHKGKLFDKIEFHECIYLCLKENIKHHQELFRYQKVLQSFSSEWLLVLYLGCGVTICLSGFLSVRAHDGSSEMALLVTVSNVLFLIETTTTALIYCWYNEKISTKCEEFQEALNSCPWTKWNVKTQKAITCSLFCNKRKCFKLRIPGIVTFSMQTFCDVLQRSYSYFNLLNATA